MHIRSNWQTMQNTGETDLYELSHLNWHCLQKTVMPLAAIKTVYELRWTNHLKGNENIRINSHDPTIYLKPLKQPSKIIMFNIKQY